jgi:hypothetical protein
LFTPVDIVDSLLKGVPHFLALGPAYFVSGLFYFAGLVTAAITRNERYHEFYAVFFLVKSIVISFLFSRRSCERRSTERSDFFRLDSRSQDMR